MGRLLKCSAETARWVSRECFSRCSFSASLCVLGVSAFCFLTQRPQRPGSFAESLSLERRDLAGPHGGFAGIGRRFLS
jgi:hypothetical protein